MRRKTLKRKQRGGANNNNNNNNNKNNNSNSNNNNNSNSNNSNNNNNNNNNNNDEGYYVNKTLIERIGIGDTFWLDSQFNYGVITANNSYEYIHPASADPDLSIIIEGTVMGFIAGMDIFEFHVVGPDEDEALDLVNVCLEHGANPVWATMINNTPGPAHFSSDEYSALCLFMAKGFDSCVEALVKKMIANDDWDEYTIDNFIEELENLAREMVISVSITNRDIQGWRTKLETMERRLKHPDRMENVLRNIEAYPEQQKQKEETIAKKKALLTELGWHPSIPELSEWKEGGPNARKHIEFLRKINKGEMKINDPEFQAWVNRPSYNYARVKQYNNKRLPLNYTRRFRKNRNNYSSTMRQMFGTNNNAFVE